MKKFVLILLCFISFTAFANNGFLQNLQNNSPKNNKTLLIFYREDCPYCNNMDKIISADVNFQKQLLEKFNVKVLDIKSEEGRLLADKFNIHAVPTLVNFDNATGESKVIKGFGGIEKLSSLLELTSVKSSSVVKVETAIKVNRPIASENTLGICGNGIVEAGENCDDGNTANGDGCSNTCSIQVGFTCTGSPSVCTATCGDGIVAGAEGCDDGNTANGDGCSSTCNVQSGYVCTGTPSVCFTICGDGIVAGFESCDDGNTTNGDGCTNTCTVQPGYTCIGSPSVCLSNAICGDGLVQIGEACDDGNVTNGDGCNNVCTIEPGFSCAGSPSVCSVICGDGVVGPGEQCDDGNTTNGDGCNNICQLEPPANDECLGAINLSGNSGSVNGNNAAATNSTGAPTPSCQPTINKDVWYSFNLAAPKLCSIAVNGPAIADPVLTIYSGSCGALAQVACDDDNGPGNYSLIQTSLNAGTYFVRVASYNVSTPGSFAIAYNFNLSNICGNSIIESSEECDDGNVTNGDGCNSICKIENASTIKGIAINTDSTRANPSAMLDVKSFDKGILIPRMSTSQRTAISAPAKGLLVFDITTNTFWYYSGTLWTEVGGTSGSAGSGLPVGTANQTLRNNGTSWIANSALQNDGTNITTTGQIKISGGTPGAGKVLTSDATGLGSWQNSSTFNTSFNANNGALFQSVPSAIVTLVDFATGGTNQFDDGANYNYTTNAFTAPATGVYHFNATVTWQLGATSFAGSPIFESNIYLNGGVTRFSASNPINFIANNKFTQVMGFDIKLTLGQTIDIRVLQSSGAAQNIVNAQLSGHRLY